ncbi:hypothetical protein PHYPSEUDO_010748 [Phytophthora pseudosyringae]|uniref:Denticleless protein n=1 Tax=Phytophthora pseudosyringae TaxID=221518 RepID=A0A8T1VCX7_9STRA|nr:hypothetical protein PHYPSEUDO_010748 [Phytophthora pseudosyringae]
MANLAQQLARLQLGASRGRYRPSKRLDDAPPVYVNASSCSLQRSAAQRALLSSLHCPAQRVLALGDGPEAPINGQAAGYMPSGPIFQVAYAHNRGLLVAVDEEGAVGVVDVVTGRRKSRWKAHHNAVFDVIWAQSDAQVLTAAGDLEIRIWDVETAGTRSLTPVSTLRGHGMSVKCVRQAPDNAHVFASGGRDGKVLLWDARATGKPVSSLENVHAEPTSARASSSNVSFTSPTQKRRRRAAAASSTSPSPRSVTCVEFGATGNEIITAGAVDAVVKFWDLRRLGTSSTVSCGKKKAVVKLPVPIREISCSSREGARRGISSLTLRHGGAGGASHLLVNVLNDSIAVIDIDQEQHQTGSRDSRTVLRCSGHQASSFYNKAAFSPEGNFIAGSSADGVVYIWDAHISTSYDGALSSAWSAVDVQQRAPCFALKGHVNEVNGVAWNSQDFTQLASCSDDGTVRCWQVGGERDQRLGNQRQEASREAARFELRVASGDESSDANGKTEWANWNEFVDQPDGCAYRVRGIKPSRAPRSSQTLSPRRQRVPLADKQRASPQVMRHNIEPRLHPVHEIPTAQQQPQQEPQGSQEAQDARPQPKRRIKLRRKSKPTAQPKRAQRTLLELWGR